ncbi:MAG: tetratricopeptide repeat-containing sensor histidine kinase [Phocaeicola sp.]
MNIKSLFLAHILLVFSALLFGQDNIYKMDNRIFDDYEKCTRIVSSSKVLPMIDTLFIRAGVVNDQKAQCMILNLKVDHFYFNNDTIQLRKAVNQAREFIVQTPYKQYYFASLGRIVYSKIKAKRYDVALAEVSYLQKEALFYNNSYGVAASYNHLGNVYMQLNNANLAIENYLKGAEYLEEHGEPENAYLMYKMVGGIYKSEKAYDKSIFYLRKSLKYAIGPDRMVSPLISFLELYTERGKMDSAHYYFNKLDSVCKISPPMGFTRDTYYRSLFRYRLQLGEYEHALSLADSTSSDRSVVLKYEAYKKMKNYEKALYWFEVLDSIEKENSSKELNEMLAQYSSRLENSKLESEMNALALQNSSMRIVQMENERNLLEAARKADNLQLQATELTLKNTKLINQKQLSEIEHARLESRRLKERAADSEVREKLHRIILYAISLFLLLSLTFTVTYFFIRRKNMRRLKEERNLALSARAEAELSNRQKSVFLENMSHEIRTPLNAIVGFSDVLNSADNFQITAEERLEYLNLIHQNTELLTTLVNDVLDISSLDSNLYSFSFSEVHLKELCKVALQTVSARRPTGVELKLDTPDASDDSFYTDVMRVQQVLVNFLTNACKHTESGSITLGYSLLSGGDVEFYVEDTGRGISADKADEIFTRFRKLDGFKQGVGLGLNICLRIAELLTGRVYLDTNYVKGARFVFFHPNLRKKESMN